MRKYVLKGIVGGLGYGLGFLVFEDLAALYFHQVQFSFRQALFSLILYLALFGLVGLFSAIILHVGASKSSRLREVGYPVILMMLTFFAVFYLGYREIPFRIFPVISKLQILVALGWGALILLLYWLSLKLTGSGKGKNPKTQAVRILATSTMITVFFVLNARVDCDLNLSTRFALFDPWWRLLAVALSIGAFFLCLTWAKSIMGRSASDGGSKRLVMHASLGIILVAGALWGMKSLASSTNRTLPVSESSGHEGSLPNIILIVIDTLRADHLSIYGYERETTPWLTQESSHAVVFTKALSPSSWTKPSVASFLTSRYPGIHSVTGWLDIVPSQLTTIPEVLGERGYQTAGFSANLFVNADYNYAQGFETFYPIRGHGPKQLLFPMDILFSQIKVSGELAFRLNLIDSNVAFGDARSMNGAIIPWLRNNERNQIFLYLHYMDPHVPYLPPARKYSEGKNLSDYDLQFMRKLHNPQDTVEVDNRILDAVVSRYDDEIINVDRRLAEVFQTLETLGLRDKSLIIITADHGEEFGDHGFGGHGHSMFQEVLHVPLLIFFPDGAYAGRRIEHQVDLLDLAPTIYDYVGVEAEAPLDGVSLMPLIRGEKKLYAEKKRDYFGEVSPVEEIWPIETTFALVEDNYKFIRSTFKDHGKPDRLALYDMAADPMEQINELENKPEIADRLSRQLDSFRHYCDSLRIRPEGLDTKNLSKEQLEQLRALGYVR